MTVHPPCPSLMWIAAVPHELGDLPGAAVGVGAVRAGVGAARALAQTQPRAVVLIGSAGAYRGGPPVGAVVQAARVGLADAAAAVGLGYTPLPPAPLWADPALRRWLALPEVDVLTTGAITTDPPTADRLGAGWQLEHLEAWAVAFAAAEAGVPFAAVFGVANEVGPDAHAQWRAHHDAVEAAVRAVLGQRLSGA